MPLGWKIYIIVYTYAYDILDLVLSLGWQIYHSFKLCIRGFIPSIPCRHSIKQRMRTIGKWVWVLIIDNRLVVICPNFVKKYIIIFDFISGQYVKFYAKL